MFNDSNFEATPIRLIQAAGALFAVKGYKKTTIRDICDLAEANIASVNYHFQDKSNLFNEVKNFVVNDVWERYPHDYEVKAGMKPEKKLFYFVRSILLRTYSPDLPSWYNLILKNEILGKSNAANDLMLEYVKNSKKYFISIANEIMGSEVDYELLEFCESFTVGQVLHLMQSDFRETLPINVSVLTYEEIDKISELITKYSIGGLKTLKEEYSDSSYNT